MNGVPAKRAIWVYVSLALMALPLVDASWAPALLLRRLIGVGPVLSLIAVAWVAFVLLVWLELTRRALRDDWPTWTLTLWPLGLFGLWAAALYFVR